MLDATIPNNTIIFDMQRICTQENLSGFAQENIIVHCLMFMAYLFDSTLLTNLFYFF